MISDEHLEYLLHYEVGCPAFRWILYQVVDKTGIDYGSQLLVDQVTATVHNVYLK